MAKRCADPNQVVNKPILNARRIAAAGNPDAPFAELPRKTFVSPLMHPSLRDIVRSIAPGALPRLGRTCPPTRQLRRSAAPRLGRIVVII
ncbi:MAG: hypothetical protein U0805_07505 [Pirellulales bacterium]